MQPPGGAFSGRSNLAIERASATRRTCWTPAFFGDGEAAPEIYSCRSPPVLRRRMVDQRKAGARRRVDEVPSRSRLPDTVGAQAIVTLTARRTGGCANRGRSKRDEGLLDGPSRLHRKRDATYADRGRPRCGRMRQRSL